MLGLRNAHKTGLSKIKSSSNFIPAAKQGQMDTAVGLKYKGQRIVENPTRNIPTVQVSSNASMGKKLEARRLKTNNTSTRLGTGISSPANQIQS